MRVGREVKGGGEDEGREGMEDGEDGERRAAGGSETGARGRASGKFLLALGTPIAQWFPNSDCATVYPVRKKT